MKKGYQFFIFFKQNVHNINFEIPESLLTKMIMFFRVDLRNGMTHVEEEDANVLLIGSPIANDDRQPFIYASLVVSAFEESSLPVLKSSS